MPDKHALDAVTVFTFIAAMIFSNEVAAVVGPYIVIIIAATVGASFRLAMSPTTRRSTAFIFFARQVFIAILLTGISAMWLSEHRPDLTPRITVAPIAMLIGYMHWPAVLGKVARMAIGALDLLRKGGKP